MTCTDVDAQTPAWTYPSLTETTCTACGCSAADPSNGVLSSPIIEYRVQYHVQWCIRGGGGGGGGGRSRKRCQLAYDMCSSLVKLSSN